MEGKSIVPSQREREPEVSQSIKELTEHIGALEQRITLLGERLQIVRTARPEKPSATEERKKKSQICELAQDIDMHVCVVEQLIALINTFLEELEI